MLLLIIIVGIILFGFVFSLVFTTIGGIVALFVGLGCKGALLTIGAIVFVIWLMTVCLG